MAGKRTVIKVNGVSLDQIDDEVMLTDLLNSSEDTETRRILRARLQEIKSAGRAKREMRIDNIGDAREQAIQQRQKEAADSKARTLAMYDNMAKSGNAGDKRALDINTYRGRSDGQSMVSGTALQKTDYVEETIRERVRASDENKKRLLAAFDYAAKTQPSGTVRDVDLAAFQGVDVSTYETEKPTNAATFRSSNGVPQVVKDESVDNSKPTTNPGAAASSASLVSAGQPVRKTSPVKGRPTNAKDALLHWCYMRTRSYDNVYVENFSSSWADGLAFCALLHHFFPKDIDYDKLTSQSRRENFDLAFKVAEDKAKVYPLLETDDMLKMGDKPDWKCVYTYVQSLYKGLKPFDPTQK